MHPHCVSVGRGRGTKQHIRTSVSHWSALLQGAMWVVEGTSSIVAVIVNLVRFCQGNPHKDRRHCVSLNMVIDCRLWVPHTHMRLQELLLHANQRDGLHMDMRQCATKRIHAAALAVRRQHILRRLQRTTGNLLLVEEVQVV
jgi:hypothetical protein